METRVYVSAAILRTLRPTAGMMRRHLIQAVAQSKGYDGDTIYDEVESMVRDGTVRKYIQHGEVYYALER